MLLVHGIKNPVSKKLYCAESEFTGRAVRPPSGFCSIPLCTFRNIQVRLEYFLVKEFSYSFNNMSNILTM